MAENNVLAHVHDFWIARWGFVFCLKPEGGFLAGLQTLEFPHFWHDPAVTVDTIYHGTFLILSLARSILCCGKKKNALACFDGERRLSTHGGGFALGFSFQLTVRQLKRGSG